MQLSRPHSSRRSSKQSSLPSTRDSLPLPPTFPHYSAPSASSTDPLIASDPRVDRRSPNTSSSVNQSTVLPQEVGGASPAITGSYSYPASYTGARLHSVEDAVKPAKHTLTSTPTANRYSVCVCVCVCLCVCVYCADPKVVCSPCFP